MVKVGPHADSQTLGGNAGEKVSEKKAVKNERTLIGENDLFAIMRNDR